jgi:LPXTG-site transpeptidase (sortase) family protein
MVLAASFALVAWGLASVRQQAYAPTRPPPTLATPTPSAAAAATLARLLIPGIGVDAPVDEIGLTPQGDLATPTDVSHVGWYRGGSLPGQPGSSVIDGHLDWRGGPAVFANLGHLHAGDQLHVTYSNGHAASFLVSTMATYPADLRPPAELFRADGPPQLVLITCAGPWDGAGYRDRLVVTAVLAPYRNGRTSMPSRSLSHA